MALLLLASIAGGASASASEAEAIAQLDRLAAERFEEIRFVEERHVTALREPIELRGRMRFQPPDTVIREIESPYAQRLIIAGERVTIVEEGRVEHQLHRDDDPALSALARLLAVLYGREEAASLSRYFALSYAGDPQQWTLTLVPKSRAARRRIEEIRLFGSAAWVARSEHVEGSGDIAVTRFIRPQEGED